MCMCRTRLTLEVVYSLVHLDGLPDRWPLLPAEEVAQLLEVFLILVERFRHLGDRRCLVRLEVDATASSSCALTIEETDGGKTE